MKASRIPLLMVGLFAVLPWFGCLGKAPIRQPAPATPPPQAQPSLRQQMESQLIGTWESQSKKGIKKMIFAAGGQLTFEGGLDYYNPARWELNPDRQELTISMPAVDVDKMQIFQLYIGQGLKSFNPQQKQVTYMFQPQTWNLNFAGWEYTKAEKSDAAPLAEPTFK